MAQAVIGALRVNLGLNSASFSKGLKKSDSKLKSFAKSVGTGLKVAAGAAAAAAAGIGLAVRGALNEADQMAKVSQQIGIPIEELSRLKHAADLSGVSFENLQTGTRRLSQNMNDAANGVGVGKEAFEALGISVKNSDGSLKSSTAVMKEISARFAEMPDGAEKTALAMDLMGRSGAAMIPMLNGGANALQSMMAEADALGIVFDEKTGKAAENFNDNLSRIQAAGKGLIVQLTASLAPALASISEKLIVAVKAFQSLSPTAQKFIGIAGGLTAALVALSIPLAAIAISFTAINAPVLAAVAAIAAITAGVVAFWPEIKAAGVAVKDFTKSIIESFLNIPDSVKQIGRDIISGLWSGIEERWEGLKSRVSGIASGVADTFKSVLRIQSPSRVMMEVGKFVMQGLSVGMEGEKASIEGTVNKIGDGISSTFEGIGSSIAGAIQGVKSWKDVAIDAVLSVAQSFAQNNFSGGGFGGNILGSLAAGIFGGFRAAGGPVSAGKSYVVGENGPEMFSPQRSGTIIPNHALGGGSKTIIQVALSPDLEARLMDSAGNQSVEITQGILRQATPQIVQQSVQQSQGSFARQPTKWQGQ